VLEKISFTLRPENTLRVKLTGDWKIASGLPSLSIVLDELLRNPEIRQVVLDTSALKEWDSGLLAFLLKVIEYCDKKNIRVERGGLPEGAGKILNLATAVREKKEAIRKESHEALLERIGGSIIIRQQRLKEKLIFLGEVFVAFTKMLRGKARFRICDLVLLIQQCGGQALPIVSLISLLVGLILAFVGAVQLRLFGAQIYIADIVGIATVRVMGAIMTGIIMAGRTGAAFAAQLGTMQTNEEIDALKTLGIPPIEFLVLPRVISLVLMMPLLCLYADVMGIVGGFIVGVLVFGLNPIEYLQHTKEAVTFTHLSVGLVHSLVFGVIVAIVGCLKGIQSGRSAADVGDATTSAVVSSIINIVIATAIITFICEAIKV
jgi:phospholipid/cholesterol/gamma-HCH transport system permease protein